MVWLIEFTSQVSLLKNKHYFLFCRVLLPVLHYNENSDRDQAMLPDGTCKYAAQFSRANIGKPSLKKDICETNIQLVYFMMVINEYYLG